MEKKGGGGDLNKPVKQISFKPYEGEFVSFGWFYKVDINKKQFLLKTARERTKKNIFRV